MELKYLLMILFDLRIWNKLIFREYFVLFLEKCDFLFLVYVDNVNNKFIRKLINI